ncbi:MAG: helix-turn-helix transcriptional regulator [Dehalococcoidia bacterium]
MSEFSRPSATSLSPSEEQLLTLIREGRVDAEIAVRMGISNAEVKDRTLRLANKLGAADKNALREMKIRTPLGESTDGPQGDIHASLLRWRMAVIVMATIAVVLGTLLIRERASHETTQVSPATGPSVAPLALATLTPTPLPSPSIIAGREMYDAGQLFVQRLGPNLISPSNRESLSVVNLGGPAVVRYADGPVHWRFQGDGPQALSLSGNVGGSNVLLNIVAQAGTQFLYGDDDSVGVFSRDDSSPTVVLWVQVPEGPAYYHAEVSSDGHLYIAAESLAANLPLAYDTGELLMLSNVLPLGDTVQGDHWILCGEGPFCSSLLRGDFIPLARGTLKCDQDEGTLTFISEGESGATMVLVDVRTPNALRCRDAVRGVVGGEPLGYPGMYSVSALARDGSLASVLITRNGVVYISFDAAKVGCPCREGT